MNKSETQEHKDLKKIISRKLNLWGLLSTEEYYDSGHELDIKARTLDSISIYIEIVKSNMRQDLLMLHRDNADVKMLVVANKELLSKFQKEYEKTAHAEIRDGYLMPNEMIDGTLILNDESYLENVFRDILIKLIDEARVLREKKSANSVINEKTLSLIKGLLEGQLQQESENKKLAFEIGFQKALEIPTEFMERKNKINYVNEELFKFGKLFVYGLTRGSKSFLISQFIKEQGISDYYWYDFKKYPETDRFYDDFVRYVCLSTANESLYKFWTNKQASPDFYLNLLLEKKQNKILIVLDNIHEVNKVENLYHMFKSYNLQTGFNVIFISEYRESLINIPNLEKECKIIEINGFDLNEIIELFSKNGINFSKPSKIFDSIHYKTMGHPDIISGLIEEVKRSEKPNYIDLINFVLGQLELTSTTKLNETLYHKLYNIQLTTDEERTLFNRLCALFQSFSRELAESVSKVEPQISNFGIVFEKLRIFLFDSEQNNKFSIPKLYKNIGESLLTIDEKKLIWTKIARELLVIKNFTVNFNNYVLAFNYLFFSEQFLILYKKLNFVIGVVLNQKVDKKTLNFVLDDLKFFALIDNVPDKVMNELMMFKLFFVNACAIAENKELEILIIKGIKDSNFEKIDDHLKAMILPYLFMQASKFANLTKQSLDFLTKVKLLLNHNKDIFKGKHLEFFSRGILYMIPILNIGTYDIPDLRYLKELLKNYVEMGFDLKKILPIKRITEFSNSLFHGFYIANFDKKLSVEAQLSNIVVDLIEVSEIFKSNNYNFAERRINYLIACLLTQYSNLPTNAIPYYKLAKTINYDKNNLFFEAEICVGIGDSFNKEKNYPEAMKNYLEAERLFEEFDSLDFLYLHSVRRIGMCYFKLDNKGLAKFYFRKAVKISNKFKNKRLVNYFDTLLDYSTYLIETGEYKSAAKIFSIMLILLNNTELKEYLAILSNCISWTTQVLAKGFSEKYSDQDRMVVKPYFEIYNDKTNYDKNKNQELTILSTYFVLGELLSQVKLNNKSKSIFEHALELPVTNKMEIVVKSLSCFKLYDLYLAENNYLKAIESIIDHIKYWENMDIDKPEFLVIKDRIFDYSEFVYGEKIIPILNLNLNKCDSIEAFKRCEVFFKYFIELAKKSDIMYKEHLIAISYSNLGLFYLYNIHLEPELEVVSPIYTLSSRKSIMDKHVKLMVISERIADKIKYYYVHIQNRLIMQFSIYKYVYDFNNYAYQNFQILFYISLGWEKYHKFICNLFSGFVSAWNGFYNKLDSNSFLEKNVISIVKESIDEFSKNQSEDTDKYMVMTIIMVRLSDTITFPVESFIKVIELCIKLITFDYKDYFEIIVSKYHSLKKEDTINSMSNIDILIQKAKEGNEVLETFERNFTNIINVGLKNKIIDFKREMQVLTGNI